MINLNDELYNEIAQTIKKNKIDFPSIKNFVEKAAMKELKYVKAYDEYMKKSRHLFNLVAERKFDEIEKIFPKSQKTSLNIMFKDLEKLHNLGRKK